MEPLYNVKPWIWLEFVSVEPSVFLSMVVATMLEFGNTNLYLQKACRTDAAEQPNLSTPCDDNEKGLTFVARINTYVHSVKMFLVLVGVILYSSWSDRAGRKRKIFLMLTMTGQLLESGFESMYSYWWTSTPVAAALTSAILQIIFGNVVTTSTFGFVYLSDVVDLDNRTMRLGIFSATCLCGKLVGRGVSGYTLHAVGFCKYYAICSGIALMAIILGYLCIADHSGPMEKKASLCSVFNLSHIVKSCKHILGKKRGKEGVTVIMLFVIFALVAFVHEGQYTVMYLYLRYRFNWNEVMYGLSLFYGCVAMLFGSLISSIILSKVLKIHDAAIGIFSAFWDAAVAISYVFVDKNWQLYLVSGLDMFIGVSANVSVSLLTKFYDSSEMGQLFAVKQLFNLSIPFCHPVYNIVFTTTLKTMPSAFLVISFGLYITVMIIYCLTYLLTRK